MWFLILCNFRADSVTWNPHKLMGALLQCSTIHFKEDVSIPKIITKLLFLKNSYRNTLMFHNFKVNLKEFCNFCLLCTSCLVFSKYFHFFANYWQWILILKTLFSFLYKIIQCKYKKNLFYFLQSCGSFRKYLKYLFCNFVF